MGLAAGGLAAAELGLEAGLLSSVMPEFAAHTPAADASSADLEALAGIGSSALAGIGSSALAGIGSSALAGIGSSALAGRGSSDDSLIELNDLVSLGLAAECLDLAAGTDLTRRVGDRSGDGGPLSTTLGLDLTVGRAEGLPRAVRYCSSDRTLSPLRSMALNSRSTVSNELLRPSTVLQLRLVLHIRIFNILPVFTVSESGINPGNRSGPDELLYVL